MALVFAPHVLWAFNSGFPTVEYALGKSNRPHWLNTYQALGTGLVALAVNVLATAVLLAALGRRWFSVLPRLWRFLKARNNAWLVMLGFGPIVSTLSLGILGYVKIAPNYMIPTAYILPLMGLAAVGSALTPGRVRAIMLAAWVFMAVALAASPLISYATVALRIEERQQLSAEIARTATSVWHAQLRAPLRIATGTEAFSLALPFYSPDSPEEFTHFNLGGTLDNARAHCARGNPLRLRGERYRVPREAGRYETPETRRVVRRFQKVFWGLSRAGDRGRHDHCATTPLRAAPVNRISRGVRTMPPIPGTTSSAGGDMHRQLW